MLGRKVSSIRASKIVACVKRTSMKMWVPMTSGCAFHQVSHTNRDNFVNEPSQWEMMLQCNVISHLQGRIHKMIPVQWRGASSKIYCDMDGSSRSEWYILFPNSWVSPQVILEIGKGGLAWWQPRGIRHWLGVRQCVGEMCEGQMQRAALKCLAEFLS